MLMTLRNGFSRIGVVSALGACTIALSGCLGPTYGTDKTATEQLFDDLGSSISLGRKGERKAIQYQPRPGLVKPEDTDTLPPPQQNIAEANEEWPESQEERLMRVRAEADGGVYRPGLARRTDIAVDRDYYRKKIGSSPLDKGNEPYEAARRREDRKNQKVEEQARVADVAPTRRVYLTDPPTEYRKPAETAAYGDLGEKESVKERRRESVGEDKAGWRKLVPWL